MIRVEGAVASAKIFADYVEPTAMEQARNLCNQPFAMESVIRFMPDIHAGAGCTIGTTMTLTDRINPFMVGVDIGCGMYCVPIKLIKGWERPLDEVVQRLIPSGRAVRDTPLSYSQYTVDNLKQVLRCHANVDLERASLSIGTLGGGNHFIEVDVDDEDNHYLVIHTGSRGLGKQVAEYYQSLAERESRNESELELRRHIAKLKLKGRTGEIENFVRQWHETQPKSNRMPTLGGTYMEDYLHDMNVCLDYAYMNRVAIATEILRTLRIQSDLTLQKYLFHSVHNYISTSCGVLRKGACSAQEGERFIVPLNMRDGSLICRGKGNPDWNCSAPHGAGRFLSRRQARETLAVDDFERDMEGIYTTTVGKATIDESPRAYKPAQEIIDAIKPTADIEKRIYPLYNFKAAE